MTGRGTYRGGCTWLGDQPVWIVKGSVLQRLDNDGVRDPVLTDTPVDFPF